MLTETVEALLRMACCSRTSDDEDDDVDGGREAAERRVHALNVLRSLYRDARLGPVMAGHLGRGLRLAIDGFRAPHWPVRRPIQFHSSVSSIVTLLEEVTQKIYISVGYFDPQLTIGTKPFPNNRRNITKFTDVVSFPFPLFPFPLPRFPFPL